MKLMQTYHRPPQKKIFLFHIASLEKSRRKIHHGGSGSKEIPFIRVPR